MDRQKVQQRAIYAQVSVEEGTQFGPYPGKDAVERKFSEWMEFVSKANCSEEANLISFTLDEQIYYKAVKLIKPFETFLVWDEKQDGIVEEIKPKTIETKLIQSMRTGLTTILSKDRHVKHRRKSNSLHGTSANENSPYDDNVDVEEEPDTSKHPCPECGIIFLTRAGLAMHRTLHLQERKCTACGASFLQHDQLNSHLTTHESDYIPSCNKCKCSFGNEFSIDEEVTFNNKNTVCVSCQSMIVINDISIESEAKKNKSGKYSCKLCRMTFCSFVSLERHLNKHMKKFECGVCKEGFGDYSILIHHLTVHTHHKPYSCNICGKGYRWPRSYSYHALSCTGANGKGEENEQVNKDSAEETITNGIEISCETRKLESTGLPEAVTEVPDNNSEHVKDEVLAHSDEEAMTIFSTTGYETNFTDNIDSSYEIPDSGTEAADGFSCKKCSQNFTSLAGLAMHNLIHCSQDKCVGCGTRFALQEKLHDHLKTHSSDAMPNCFRCQIFFQSQFYPYVTTTPQTRYNLLCANCDNRYINIVDDFNSALLLDVEEAKEYRCQTCNKVFQERNKFYAHSIQHHRKFSCLECSKSFGAYYHLVRHVVVHTKCYPFFCKYCKKRYKRQNMHVCEYSNKSMISHLVQVTPRKKVLKKECLCCSKDSVSKHKEIGTNFLQNITQNLIETVGAAIETKNKHEEQGKIDRRRNIFYALSQELGGKNPLDCHVELSKCDMHLSKYCC